MSGDENLDGFDQPDDVGGLGEALQGILGLFTLNGAALSGVAGLLQNEDMREHRPSLLTIPELLELKRRGILDWQRIEGELARLGYSSARIFAIEQMVNALPDAGSLLELLRRGEITDSDYTASMEQLGFTAGTSSLLASLRYYLPPVQDVIRFMVREVFTPETRARFGQDEDFPDSVLDLSRRLGVRDEDMRAYWAAHWELPSPSQGFEMFQRSAETGVTADDLAMLLKAHDVMPFWRDAMVKIAYNPITRVDVRRLHKLGLLDHQGLVDRYQRIGYNPEDAELLAQFTDQLNAAEDDALRKSDATALTSRIRSMYLDGAVSADELGQALATLGYSDGEVSALVSAAELERLADHRTEQRAAVKSLYTQGHIDTTGAIERLARIGYSTSEANRIAEPWHALRELRELNDAERADRDLTRADVLGGYEDALLSADAAREHLNALGYDAAEIDVLLARVDVKVEKAKRQDAEASTKALYLARRITRAQAQSALTAGRVTNDRAMLLLAQWDAQLDAKTPELTVAQVSAAYRQRIIVREAAADRLDAMGYSEEDREILLQLVEKGQGNVE